MHLLRCFFFSFFSSLFVSFYSFCHTPQMQANPTLPMVDALPAHYQTGEAGALAIATRRYWHLAAFCTTCKRHPAHTPPLRMASRMYSHCLAVGTTIRIRGLCGAVETEHAALSVLGFHCRQPSLAGTAASGCAEPRDWLPVVGCDGTLYACPLSRAALQKGRISLPVSSIGRSRPSDCAASGKSIPLVDR